MCEMVSLKITSFRPSLPAYDLELIPKVPGVYALWDGLVCVYVGSATNLYGRVGWHNHAGKFDRATWMQVPEIYLQGAEKLWMDHLSPALNKRPAIRPKPQPRSWYWSNRKQHWVRCSDMARKVWKREGRCVAHERPSDLARVYEKASFASQIDNGELA